MPPEINPAYSLSSSSCWLALFLLLKHLRREEKRRVRERKKTGFLFSPGWTEKEKRGERRVRCCCLSSFPPLSLGEMKRERKSSVSLFSFERRLEHAQKTELLLPRRRRNFFYFFLSSRRRRGEVAAALPPVVGGCECHFSKEKGSVGRVEGWSRKGWGRKKEGEGVRKNFL